MAKPQSDVIERVKLSQLIYFLEGLREVYGEGLEVAFMDGGSKPDAKERLFMGFWPDDDKSKIVIGIG